MGLWRTLSANGGAEEGESQGAYYQCANGMLPRRQ